MKSIQLGVLLLSYAVTSPADISMYTTLADDNQVPVYDSREQFYCTDQIFAVVELDNYAIGDHNLQVSWFTPAGELTERTRYKFLVLNDHERIWAWLKLHRETGAGVLRLIDPAAGMQQFIGSWRVSIEIDNTPVGSVGFEVIC